MRRSQHHGHRHPGERLRGIYLLPNLLTSASLFSGFYALVAAIHGDFRLAAVAILAAAVFDGLDGRVARLTGTTSRFGIEYDSLSDLVAFGVAPGVLAFLWGLQGFGRPGWLAAFLYVATTALRLARFNAISISGVSGSKRYFLGLPCPAAAAMVATTVLMAQYLGVQGPVRHYAVLALVYGLSFLMVSTVRFFSFKEVPWFQRHPFSGMVALILAMVVVAVEPKVTLFFLMALYVASGPAGVVVRTLRPGHEAAGERRRS
ncbi:CDP-diacylglycerol--serine O-phosphatidyltransferase [Dissulfurirhabdus thermomarina]|uniref:CDP-diacylglycerol--serine O-phosphatidyltransferase n=1 Tax=Dissulfurirhabdus thermomarina TaxID=1765737 RepID=A0A6N9TJA7_DISTH|nr:CDP-diacylglycerol--serine O-phosphatidyltransferase [Dissulfurirhabdus thermomarina]NDY41341.1 CDP-diacylglycerol--serine O-phosphatidyltransferase [Dissulfurirhabdus thermomarina]NMX23276.1 CDP-diacylglycerol--serine O-phosphatidyltransferase [Dissulfurirhabdus thermomarina]